MSSSSFRQLRPARPNAMSSVFANSSLATKFFSRSSPAPSMPTADWSIRCVDRTSSRASTCPRLPGARNSRFDSGTMTPTSRTSGSVWRCTDGSGSLRSLKTDAACVLFAAYAAAVVSTVAIAGLAGADEVFVPGNCAVTKTAARFEASNGNAAEELRSGEYLKILASQADRIEAAWIPSLVDGCEYANGVFAGWVRRSDMTRQYPAGSGGNEYASVQPAEPAPFFDRPDGSVIGTTRRNDNLWVVARRSDGW